MLNYQPPVGQTYQQLRFDLILNVEESGTVKLNPYLDGEGFVTIGVGFNLHDAVIRNELLTQWQISPAHPAFNPLTDLLSAEYADIADFNSALEAENLELPGRDSFAFNDANEAEAFFNTLVQNVFERVFVVAGAASDE